MAEGRSNQAIAERLFITERTVERHVNAIFTKLGIHAKSGRLPVRPCCADLSSGPVDSPGPVRSTRRRGIRSACYSSAGRSGREDCRPHTEQAFRPPPLWSILTGNHNESPARSSE